VLQRLRGDLHRSHKHLGWLLGPWAGSPVSYAARPKGGNPVVIHRCLQRPGIPGREDAGADAPKTLKSKGIRPRLFRTTMGREARKLWAA